MIQSRYILGTMLVVLLFKLSACSDDYRKRKALSDNSNNEVAYPYRTIDSFGHGRALYAYVLHRQDGSNERYITYGTVIRNIDPSKDDYKGYCRAVITDIIRTSGSDKIVVSIYDSDEAYELSEIKYAQQYRVLSNKETDTVNKHTVAVYYGTGNGDGPWTNRLQFYPDANNRHTSKELFMP